MEETKNRLSRLLSQERAIRKEESHTAASNGRASDADQPRTVIDTSPLTSPENIAKTRRRLSRLFESRTYDYSKQDPQDILSQRLFHENNPQLSIRPNVEDSMRSPGRAPRRRASIQPRDVLPVTQPAGKSPGRSTRGPVRSLSPLPASRRRSSLQRSLADLQPPPPRSISAPRLDRSVPVSTARNSRISSESWSSVLPARRTSVDDSSSSSSRWVRTSVIDQGGEAAKDTVGNYGRRINFANNLQSDSLDTAVLKEEEEEEEDRPIQSNGRNNSHADQKTSRSVENSRALLSEKMAVAEKSTCIESDDADDLLTDLSACEEMDARLADRLLAIRRARDRRALSTEISASSTCFDKANIVDMQLWLWDSSADALVKENSNGSTSRMTSLQTDTVLQSARSRSQSFSDAYSTATTFHGPNVSTWLPEHRHYSLVAAAAEQGMDGLSSGAFPFNPPLDGSRVAIHAFMLTPPYEDIGPMGDAPPRSSTAGVVLVVEKGGPAPPFSRFVGVRENNVMRMRRFSLQQLLCKLCCSVEHRLLSLQLLMEKRDSAQLREMEKRDSAQLREEMNRSFAEKDESLLVKDSWLQKKTEQAQLRDRLQSSLLACTTLLLETASGKRPHTAFIATVLAKSGCVHDSDDAPLTNCWLVLKDCFPSGVDGPDSSLTCVVSGNVREGERSPIYLPTRSKLLDRLFHPSSSSSSSEGMMRDRQQVRAVAASRQDLVESELHTTCPHSSNTISILHACVDVYMPDKIVSEGPGCGMVTAMLIIAVTRDDFFEYAQSHLESLTQLTSRAFLGLHQQERSLRRQLLLEVPCCIYESMLPTPRDESSASPLFQASLLKLLEVGGSSEVASKLQVRKCAILLSDQFVCSLNDQIPREPTDNATRQLVFMQLVSNGASSVQPVCCPAVDTQSPWVQDLLQGRCVLFDHAVEGTADTEREARSRSAGSSYWQSSSTNPIKALTTSRQSLKSLVHAVDTNASYALMMPLRTAAGLSVVVLVDPCSQRVNAKSQATGGALYVTPFTQELTTAIAESGVPASILNMLELIYRQSTSHWSGLSWANDKMRIDLREKSLLKIIARLRAKSLLSSAYSQWKMGAQRSTSSRQLQLTRAMLSGLMALVTHRENSSPPSSSDCIQSFLDVLKAILESSFPTESVSVSADVSTIDNANRRLDEDPSRIYLSGRVLSAVDPVSSLQDALLSSSSSSGIRASNRHAVKSILPDRSPTLDAVVTLSRPKLIRDAFRPEEVAEFDGWCSMAAQVFSALERGHRTDYADGDARSWALPLLCQLIPQLALVTGSTDDDALQDSEMTTLVLWLKRACGADIVSLRIPRPAGQDLVLSSEEMDEAAVRATLQKSMSHSISLLGLTDLIHASSHPPDGGPESESGLLLLRLRDTSPGAAPLGELKLFNSQRRAFSQGQQLLAYVVAGLLTHAIRSLDEKRDFRGREARLLADAEELHCAAATMSETVAAEQQTTKEFKLKLSSALATMLFLEKLCEASTMQQVCSLICDGLPQLVGLGSAVLVLHPSQIDASAVAADDSAAQVDAYKVMLPRSNRASDSLESSMHFSLSGSSMSVLQLSQIPNLFDDHQHQYHPPPQSKIDLLSPIDGTLIGAIILFPPSSLSSSSSLTVPARESSSTANTYHPPSLQSSLSTTLFYCCSRFRRSQELAALNGSLSDALRTLKEQEHFEADLVSLMNLRGSLETQRDALLVEVEGLRHTVDEVTEDRDSRLVAVEEELRAARSISEHRSSELTTRLQSLSEAIVIEQSRHKVVSSQKQRLIDLISGFSFDHRCQRERVMQWLLEVAEGQQVQLQVVSQAEGGVLQGADGVRGVVAAAAEAIRTGIDVEFAVSDGSSGKRRALHDSSSDRDRDALDYGHLLYLHSKSQQGSELFSSSKESKVNSSIDDASNMKSLVLCIPNRCITGSANSDHACFVFVRRSYSVEGGDTSYPADVRELLSCAVNLTCRVLAQANPKYGEKEHSLLSNELNRIRIYEARVKQVLSLGDSLRSREYGSKAEVSQSMQLGVSELLSRGPEDPCIVLSSLCVPPWYSLIDTSNDQVRKARFSSTLYSGSEEADAEALRRVLSGDTRVLRKGGLCWLPIVDHRKEVVAVLRVERRFADHAVDMSARRAAVAGGDGAPLHESKADSSSSSGMMMMPSISLLFITDFDEQMLALYATFAEPLLERMDFISDAFEGVQQAGQAIAVLQQSRLAIEDKCATEVARRLEVEEALKTGASLLGLASSTRCDAHQLVDAVRRSVLEVTSSMDCFVVLPGSERLQQVGREASEESKLGHAIATASSSSSSESATVGYYTLVSDLPHEVEVRFEPGDLEVAAMQSQRSIAAPSSDTDVSRESWSVRRMQGRLSFGQDLEHRPTSGSDSDSTLYVLAVPFALRSGVVALVSVVRRAAAFSSTDRECILWICKVLSYCLAVKGVDKSLSETAHGIKDLQLELNSLREIDRHLDDLELCGRLLDADLSIFKTTAANSRLACRLQGEQFDKAMMIGEGGDEGPVQPAAADTAISSGEAEEDALEVILSAAKLAFGQASVVESWSAIEAVNRFGINLLLPSQASDRPPHSGSYRTALEYAQHITAKDSIATRTGQLTYWVDAEGRSVEGLTFFQLVQDPHSTTAAASLAKHNLYISVPTATTGPIVYAAVELRGYPTTWLKIQTATEAKILNNLNVRLKVMLHVLATQEVWRSSAISIFNSSQRSIRRHQEEASMLRAELVTRRAELEEVKGGFKSDIDSTFDRYKSIVVDKSSKHRKAERVFIDSLVHVQRVRKEIMLNSSEEEASSLLSSVLKCMLDFAESTQVASGMSVSIGQGGIEDMMASDNTVDRRGSMGGHDGMDAKAAAPRAVVSSDASRLQWVTSSQSPGRNLTEGGSYSRDPLQTALSTGKVVVVVLLDEAGIDQKGGKSSKSSAALELRETVMSIGSRLCASTSSIGKSDNVPDDAVATDLKIIAPNGTHPYSSNTIIIPVKLPHLLTTIVVLIRPDTVTAVKDASGDVSKYVMHAVLSGWLAFRQCVVDAIQGHMREQTISLRTRESKKQLALGALERALLTSDNRMASKAHAFEKLNSDRWRGKWSSVADLQPRLRATRGKLHVVEQLAADWTELVKGVNGAAAGGISDGLSGLWSRACRTLMNMMSSHLTIKGCGLLVPADATGSEATEETASDIVEYVVRELSTPPNSDIGRRKSSLHHSDLSSSFMGGEPEEVPDYSRATLERRPGSELGANVYNLALDILEGRTGNQRIFKLSRAKTLLRSGRPMAGDESLWLVPIRTARAVLAVVRVSVELPRKGEHQSMRSRNPSSMDILVDSDSSKADRIEEAMRQEADLLEAAQSNMINFAEVIAPLCVAALLIEKMKARGDYLSESVDKSTSQMRLLTKEVSAGTKKCALLSSAIAAIGSTAAIDFASTCAPSEMLQSFCDRVATALSTQLSGEVKIHVQRDTAAAISVEGSPMPLASSSPHIPLVTAKSNSEATNNTSSSASEPPSYSEALLDHDGRSFGKVVFTPRTPPPLVEEDAAASRPVPQSLNFLAVHPLTAVGEAVFALRPICSVLAGLLLLIRREMALLTNTSSLALQVRLKDESIGAKSEELSACTRRYEQEVAANNFYKDLSDAAKQCVVCLTTDRPAAVDDDPSHVHLEEGDQKFVVRSTLLNMLTALSRQLASLVGRPSSVSFGVLDLTARTHLTTPDNSREEQQQQAMDDLLEKSVFWVHGHSSSSDSPAPPGRLDWQHVHVGARDILLNLANSCIAKRSKSVFDIGMSPDMHYGSSSLSDSKHEPQSDQMIVRVLTYPLLSRGESDQGCCGVLQCLLDPRGGSYSNAHVEYLCEYMAHTVSCVLTVEVQQQKLHVKVLRRKLSQLTAEEASTELQQSKLMWQQRALTWRKFARFACDALSPNHVFDDVTELFKSQAAAAALAEMGIRSTLKRGSLTDQEMNKWSATEAAGLTRLPVAPSLVPLTESNDVFLELTCDPSTEEDLHRDSAELIASVAEVVRNTVSVQKVVDAISKDSEAVNGRAALRIEELQVELRRSKEDIMASESKSAEVIGRNEELSSERAELERKCSELSKTQSELSRDCQRLSKDCRASVLWIDKFRALASMSLYKLCAPAASDIAGLLVGSIAELQQQQAPSPSSPAQRMKTVKEMNDWNYESIAKVLDRSIMRIGGGALVHHASILVRTAVTDSLSSELLQVRVFEGGKPSSDAVHTIVASKNEQTVLSSYRSSKHAMQANAAASVVSESIVEQCLRHGGTMEVGEEMVQAIDLVGINYAALSTIFDSGPSAKPTVSCSLLCVSLHPVSAAGQQQASSAVIRILYQQPTGAAVDTARLVVDRVEMQKLRSLELEMFNASLLRPLVEIVATIGCAVMQVSSDLQRRSLVSEGAQDIAEKGRVETELSQLQLSRIRKLHRVVCREAGALLDPPLVGPVGIYTGTGEGMRAVHPAALTPLSASQDTCLKLLSVIRTLLRSEGQALLLRDNHTAAADPAVASYQVIYTGDCLVWAGIEPSAFGVITASGRAAGRESLVESTMRSRRCLHTMNAPNDPRYYAYLDGICDLGTPVLMVPMRGRGGSVVGTLVAARGKGATAFSSEDVIAAEICSSFGALSLYWCQGMGSLHQQLLKNTHKMDKLEKLVKKLGDAAS